MRLYFFIILLSLVSCVVADEPEKRPLTSLKVDIAELAEAGAVRPVGGITSSGQPDAEALKLFKDSGYVTVIDLRGESENRGLDESAVVEELGMRYVSFPLASGDAINFDSAAKLDQLIEAQEGPVLLHCGSGDRVGAMLALIESQKGADDEQAIARGKEGGLRRYEPLVRERLKEK